MSADNRIPSIPDKFQFRVNGKPGRPPTDSILYTATKDSNTRYLIEWYSPRNQRDSSSYYPRNRVEEFIAENAWDIVGFENNEEALSLLHEEE